MKCYKSLKKIAPLSLIISLCFISVSIFGAGVNAIANERNLEYGAEITDSENSNESDDFFTEALTTPAQVQEGIRLWVSEGRIGKTVANRTWAKNAGVNNCYDFVKMLCSRFYGYTYIGSQGNASGTSDSKCILTGNSSNFVQVGKTLSNRYGSDSNVSAENLRNLFSQAQPGDIVQLDITNTDKSGNKVDSVHVLMIYSVSNTGVVFYHYYGYTATDGTSTIGGSSSQHVYAVNGVYNLTTEVTFENLAKYDLGGADDGISIYHPRCVTGSVSIPTPSNMWVKTDKTAYFVGENVSVSFGADNAVKYWVCIDKQGYGRWRTSATLTSGNYSTQLEQAGNYDVYFECCNSVNSYVYSGKITISIYDPITGPWISARSNAKVGER